MRPWLEAALKRLGLKHLFRQNDVFVLRRSTLLIGVVPVTLFIVGDLLLQYMGWQGHAPPLPDLDFGLGRQEASARLYLMTGFIGICGVALFAILLFVGDLVQIFGRSTRLLLLAGALAGGCTMTVWFKTSSLIAYIEPQLGQGYFKSAVEHIETEERCRPVKIPLAETIKAKAEKPPRTVKRLACEHAKSGLYDRFQTLISWARWLLIAACTCLIFGAISCLAEPARRHSAWAKQVLGRFQRRRFQRYVNAMALLLVVGLFAQILWMRWPIFLYGASDEAKAYATHVDTLSLFYGVYFSLIIASYVLPISDILRNRETRGLLLGGSDGQAPAATQGGLGALPVSLVKGLAVFAPVLASVIPSILDLLKVPG